MVLSMKFWHINGFENVNVRRRQIIISGMGDKDGEGRGNYKHDQNNFCKNLFYKNHD